MDELWKELQSVREDLRMATWLADGFDREKTGEDGSFWAGE